MSILSALTAKLITSTCDDLSFIDAATAHIKGPHDGFHDYFTTPKFSLCTPQPLHPHHNLANRRRRCKSRAHHLRHRDAGPVLRARRLRGGETCGGAEGGVSCDARRGDEGGRGDVVNMLRDALVRFPGLKSVRVEGRPCGGGNGGNDGDGDGGDGNGGYMPSFGEAKVRGETGAELAWNGPFPRTLYLGTSNTSSPSTFPTKSRAFVFAAVFVVLRDKDILGKRIHFDLVVGGYTDAVGRSYFMVPFDPTKALPRRVIERNLRYLETRDADMTIPGPDAHLRDFLSKIGAKQLVLRRCVLCGGGLGNAFFGFEGITSRDCVDVRGLELVVREHRDTLCELTLSNAEMGTGVDGTEH
ncbi:hypothetical protein K458DRAFT_468735 [Lentithecium fluviatile CBS 122367]|uniref:Uncharacterized protein n=1 Tax=Lentithecium fluviatile CBS 122367 TaxID=1168545 RepID=A0A6G1IDD9_9PLEO|nr:hypothetical protein K458DRAFT_468735 [Lentithecium fluviatile CBS 122367]